jgi:hypothetical protein
LCVLYKKSRISLWEKVHSTSRTTIELGLKYFIKSTTRIQKQQKVNQLGPGPTGSDRVIGSGSGSGPGPTSSNKSGLGLGPGPGPTSSNKSGLGLGPGPGPKNLGPDGL